MIGALWGFQGWALFAPMAGEVRDPQRNIPRASFLQWPQSAVFTFSLMLRTFTQ